MTLIRSPVKIINYILRTSTISTPSAGNCRRPAKLVLHVALGSSRISIGRLVGLILVNLTFILPASRWIPPCLAHGHTLHNLPIGGLKAEQIRVLAFGEGWSKPAPRPLARGGPGGHHDTPDGRTRQRLHHRIRHLRGTAVGNIGPQDDGVRNTAEGGGLKFLAYKIRKNQFCPRKYLVVCVKLIGFFFSAKRRRFFGHQKA